MDARTETLARIAACNVPPAPAARPPIVASSRTREAIIGQFVEYAAEYKANVVRCSDSELSSTVGRLVEGRRVLVPEGLRSDAVPVGATIEIGMSFDQIGSFDTVVTTATVAIAETGTVILDHGPGQGRRALTLVPDHHVALVREDQIVDSVNEAVALLEIAVRNGQPLTWISGPSATSDIELSRVEGVHGPRRLDIVVISP